MKHLSIILLSLTCFWACRQKDEHVKNIVELPVELKEGFGPFAHAYGLLAAEYTPDNPGGKGWVKTYLPVSGIPKAWKKVVKSMVVLDIKQLVYQNFHQGKIDSSMYLELQKSWKWQPDSARLSEKPIRCYVYVARGIEEHGKPAVIIDLNNNLDFSDERPFYPETASKKDTLRHYNKSFPGEYETYRNGKVATSHIPMIIKYITDEAENFKFNYSFPQYATADIQVADQKNTIAINFDFTMPFTDAVSELVLLDNDHKEKKVKLGNGIAIGEFIDIGAGEQKKRYKNLGFNFQKGVLQLQGESLTVQTFSTQPGFLLQSFSGNEFSSGKPITLNDYQGKYLFIDFWGTWCKPCVEELPALSDIYRKTNKDRIAFLGIAGHDNEKRLKAFLKNKPVEWQQIISDSSNKILETYRIDMFPSNFIIDPDGRIVAKNLHKEELKNKLRELGCL